MLRNCPNCKPHAYQDAKYGNKVRVYTKGAKAEHRSRCTVCDREHSVQSKK